MRKKCDSSAIDFLRFIDEELTRLKIVCDCTRLGLDAPLGVWYILGMPYGGVNMKEKQVSVGKFFAVAWAFYVSSSSVLVFVTLCAMRGMAR